MLDFVEDPPFTVGGVAKSFFVDEKRLLQRWASFDATFFRKGKLLPPFNLIKSYVEAVRKDLPSPVTVEDGMRTINLLECIEQSLDLKKPIAMNV